MALCLWPSISCRWPPAPPSIGFRPTCPSAIICDGGGALNISFQQLLLWLDRPRVQVPKLVAHHITSEPYKLVPKGKALHFVFLT